MCGRNGILKKKFHLKNETEIVPFPNDEAEFSLPDDFSTLLKTVQQTKSELSRKSSSRQSLAKSKPKLNNTKNIETDEANDESESDVESKSLQTDKNETFGTKDEIEDVDETSSSDVVEASNTSRADSRKRTNSKRYSLPNKSKSTTAPVAKPATSKKRKV
jgi:hypothetical protein